METTRSESTMRGKTMTLIQTDRLNIDEAIEAEIPEIIEIESHPENRDYLWIGTPEEHRDEIRARMSKYYKEHRDQENARHRKYYHDHLEQCRAQRREYRRKRKKQMEDEREASKNGL